MTITSAFIIYLVLFRIAIIAAGTVSIILGYKLFCKGIGPDDNSKKGTDADVKIAGTSIKLKNAAPGTCFALFGVVIISTMFITGGPGLTLKTLKDTAKKDFASGPMTTEGQFEVMLRGNGKDALSAATRQGLFYEEKKDTTKAIAAYEEAVSLIAVPMNNLAWLYLKEGRIEDSISLSQIAVQLTPNNTNHLDTRAEALFKSGNYTEALQVMEKAAKLDPQYQHKLAKFRQAVATP